MRVCVCSSFLAGSGEPASRARSGAPRPFPWPLCLSSALLGPFRAWVAPVLVLCLPSSVSLDTFHIGKAKGEDGRVYDGVVVCVDRLSGVAIVEPILFEGLTGAKIGKVPVWRWLSVFNVPVEVTTDHDPKFTSAWFDTLCSGLGVNMLYSHVYRSQTNGRAEVAGRQLFQILRRTHLEEASHGISWVQCIWAVLRACHQTKGHLGLSLQEILFGREKLGPAPCTPPCREAVCATQWLQKMGDMDRLARSLQEQELQKYKQRYNQHRPESTAYFAGDLVWVQAQRPHSTVKLAPYWVVPCEVVSRKGRDTYLVNMTPRSRWKSIPPT